MEICATTTNYIENFISEEFSKSSFHKLLKEIPWTTFEWNGEIDSPSYIYSTFERELTKKDTLEDLIVLIETAFETDVLQVRCKLYKNGEDGMSSRHTYIGGNVMHVLLGTSRKLVRKENEKTVFTMRNGCIVHIPSNENTPITTFSVKKNKKVTSPSVHMCFYMNELYKYRYYGKCEVHLLGYGNMKIDYDKRMYPNGISDKTVVAISRSDMTIRPIIGNNVGINLPGDHTRLLRLFEG